MRDWASNYCIARVSTLTAGMIRCVSSASYVINSSDLHAVSVGNKLCKYADDTRHAGPMAEHDITVIRIQLASYLEFNTSSFRQHASFKPIASFITYGAVLGLPLPCLRLDVNQSINQFIW